MSLTRTSTFIYFCIQSNLNSFHQDDCEWDGESEEIWNETEITERERAREVERERERKKERKREREKEREKKREIKREREREWERERQLIELCTLRYRND